MGIDIHGWIELREGADAAWRRHKSLRQFVNRSDDMPGCLFGVKTYAHFRPVARRRGLPPEVRASSSMW